MACVTRHRHTDTLGQPLSPMLGASQQRREVWWERGKERRQTRDVHAHFTHMILYSTASIETSLDYYMDKNVVLRPARMTDREGTRRLC